MVSAMWEEKLDVLETSDVHWSTSTIMTIFVASSLISAVFFGLGYSFGRGGINKATAAIASSDVTRSPTPTAAAPTAQEMSSKPMLRGLLPVQSTPAGSAVDTHSSSASQPPVRAILKPVAVAQNIHKPASPVTATEINPPPFVAHTSVAASSGASRYMVQVGAIGDRKDAQMLVVRLRKRGLHAGIYPGKHDKFLHVQLGPFANMQQAKAMRHQVMASGYHALLKPAS